MAVIKVFDSVGVKTLFLMGNAEEQPYDALEEDEEQEEDDNPF